MVEYDPRTIVMSITVAVLIGIGVVELASLISGAYHWWCGCTLSGLSEKSPQFAIALISTLTISNVILVLHLAERAGFIHWPIV